jgi:soluble lytic murein transglycosylase
LVEKYSEHYQVPVEMVYGMIKAESGFRSDAVSGAGAAGLMQITEATFDWITSRLGENLSKGLLYDPDTNIRYGTYYLNYLFKEFGSWDMALAAYNAGPNRVKSWTSAGDWDGSAGKLEDIPYAETRNYVKKVLKIYDNYRRIY